MNVEIAGRAETLDQGDRACVRILHLKPGLLDEEARYQLANLNRSFWCWDLTIPAKAFMLDYRVMTLPLRPWLVQ